MTDQEFREFTDALYFGNGATVNRPAANGGTTLVEFEALSDMDDFKPQNIPANGAVVGRFRVLGSESEAMYGLAPGAAVASFAVAFPTPLGPRWEVWKVTYSAIAAFVSKSPKGKVGKCLAPHRPPPGSANFAYCPTMAPSASPSSARGGPLEDGFAQAAAPAWIRCDDGCCTLAAN